MQSSSITSLLRRVEKVRRDLDPVPEPRQYSMCLMEGEEVSPALRAQLNKYDTLFIRHYPRAYLGPNGPEGCISEEEARAWKQRGQVMSCWIDKGRRGKVPHVVREYNDIDIDKV